MGRPLILIWGESSNDTAALRELIPALLPEAYPVHCRPIREPGTLSRGAAIAKRKAVTKAIAIVAKYEARSRSVTVVAHEDCDECEDAHVARVAQIKAELRAEGVTRPVAAAPAWELETWWMLFPEALARARGCWSAVNFDNRQVGKIEDAKEVLRRVLRPKKQPQCPDYSETDSERIAREIALLGLARDPNRVRKSASLSIFRDDLLTALGLAKNI